jgi:replication factor A1
LSWREKGPASIGSNAEPDLRVKAVVDDGSGAMVAIFNRQLTEGLLKKTLDACVAESKDNQEVIRDQLADMLVAQPVEVTGDVTCDDYGLMMQVNSARVLKVDLAEEAKGAP